MSCLSCGKEDTDLYFVQRKTNLSSAKNNVRARETGGKKGIQATNHTAVTTKRAGRSED